MALSERSGGFIFRGFFIVILGVGVLLLLFLNQHLQTFKLNLTSTEISNLPQTGTLIKAQCVLPVPLPIPNARQEASLKF